jgi:hypothetical protein
LKRKNWIDLRRNKQRKEIEQKTGNLIRKKIIDEMISMISTLSNKFDPPDFERKVLKK